MRDKVQRYIEYRKKPDRTYIQSASREKRGRETAEITELNIYGATGEYVLGPALNSFVIWVLQSALKQGKRRLYFLARDGYFMYRAAKVYAEKFSLPITCRYLSCSRYSLRLPAFHLNTEDAVEYICRDSIGVNLIRIMNRAGLEEQEQKRVLEDIGARGKGEEPISYVRLEEVKERLRTSKVFMEALDRRSREALPALSGYLRQEGLLEGEKDALVDSGWVGSMQKTLNRLLISMGRKEALEGYYWGLYELPEGAERAQYHCYYFSPEGQLREKVHFNNNLFEAIFSAPHGMTLGYEKKRGRYEPVYAPVSAERRWQMEELEEALLWSVRQRAEQMKRDGETIMTADCSRERKTLRKLLRLFMGKPTKAEAEAYGRLHFCDDVLEYGNRQLAEILDERELKANHALNKILVLTGLKKEELKESAWYEGSAVRCSARPWYHLLQYGIYKYLLYIRQMYMWRKSNAREKEEQKNRQGQKTEYAG